MESGLCSRIAVCDESLRHHLDVIVCGRWQVVAARFALVLWRLVDVSARRPMLECRFSLLLGTKVPTVLQSGRFLQYALLPAPAIKLHKLYPVKIRSKQLH